MLTGYGRADQVPLGAVTSGDLAEMAFPAGSMGPKVAASRWFVDRTGGRAALGSVDSAVAVVAGTAGTPRGGGCCWRR